MEAGKNGKSKQEEEEDSFIFCLNIIIRLISTNKQTVFNRLLLSSFVAGCCLLLLSHTDKRNEIKFMRDSKKLKSEMFAR